MKSRRPMMVSVIIPTYNRSAQVKEAVQSVLAQTTPPGEVIVVDDGSSDNTAEVLRAFGPSIGCVYQSHSGVSAARNRGIRMAAGEWLAFLDSDDLWLPQKLQVQIDYLRQHPQTAICQTEEIWLRDGLRLNPKKHHEKPSGHCFQHLLERCLISPSAVVMHRDVLEAVGLFDETLPACEDYDLWLRIGYRYPIGLAKEALIVKRGGHADQLSSSIPALDKYRIRALQKLLSYEALSRSQQIQTLRVLERKCQVYGKGCRKRGRVQEADRVLGLARGLAKELGISAEDLLGLEE